MVSWHWVEGFKYGERAALLPMAMAREGLPHRKPCRSEKNSFLRNSGNTVILALECTQSGQIAQLSGPNKYGRHGALGGKCMV